MHSSPLDFSTPSEPAESRPYQMAYWEAYTYLFEHPKWLVNLLLAMLCQFIPVVGPIVLLGYEYELILALHRRRDPPYPEFDFGRFSDYLSRGIWPFLVNMIQGVILFPILYILMIVLMVVGTLISVGANQGGQGPDDVVFLAMMPVFGLLFITLTALMGMFAMPMRLRAGLTSNIGEAFNFGFVKEFIGLVWWELLLANLFIFFTAPLVLLAGLLVCFVGVYPAGTMIFMALSHMTWQLYELYLSRGGTPIPLPEDDIYDAVVA